MSDSHKDAFALERILFFSDGLFAIAITLLVIEVRVPAMPHDVSNQELLSALIGLTPRIIGFMISFFLIGQTWVEHHRMGRQWQRFDRGLLWKNLFLLFFVAAMPFASGLLSEYFGSSVAIAVYGSVFAGLGLAKAALWRHSVSHNLVDRNALESLSISRRIWATPMVAAAVAIAGGLGVPFAFSGLMLIPLVALLLDRRGSRRGSKDRQKAT